MTGCVMGLVYVASNQCFITDNEWSMHMLEYIACASKVTSFAFGGIWRFITSSLNESESLIYHGRCIISFCSSRSSHLLTGSIDVPTLATIGLSFTGCLWTLAVAQKRAMLLP